MSDSLKQGEKASFIAGLVTLLFALAKLIVGLLAGSVILIADSIHSFSDLLGTVIAWVGLRISQKKATAKFKYGFYKAESLAALIIAILIIYAAWEIGTTSYNHLFSFSSLTLPIVAISVAILDGIFMFWVGTYERNVAKKIKSQSLLADGTESRLHIFSSSIVIVGLLAAVFKLPYLEGIAGLLIALLVAKEGLVFLKDAIYSLMDISPDKKVEDKIKRIIRKNNVESFRDLRLRKSGMSIFGEVTVAFKKIIKIPDAHHITEKIENQIKEQVPEVESVNIHIEPRQSKKNKILIPIKSRKGLNSELIEHFGRANDFMFIEVMGHKIKNFYYRKNPYIKKEVRAGLSATKLVLKENPDLIITKQLGRISFHALRDSLVEVFYTDECLADKAMEKYFKGELKLLEEPTKEKD